MIYQFCLTTIMTAKISGKRSRFRLFQDALFTKRFDLQKLNESFLPILNS
jgi:hypothetical protein